MDDLYLEGALNILVILNGLYLMSDIFPALGITDEVEILGLKGNKKKKGKKLDEDWVVSPYFLRGQDAHNFSSSFSRYSSPSWRRTYPKWSKLCDKRKAARSYSSF